VLGAFYTGYGLKYLFLMTRIFLCISRRVATRFLINWNLREILSRDVVSSNWDPFFNFLCVRVCVRLWDIFSRRKALVFWVNIFSCSMTSSCF
jgi:hypothetical protein